MLGIGITIHRKILGYLAILLASGTALAEGSTSSTAHRTLEISSGPARLIIIPQNGIDLRLSQNNSILPNSPLGRHGEEYVLIPTGTNTHITISSHLGSIKLPQNIQYKTLLVSEAEQAFFSKLLKTPDPKEASMACNQYCQLSRNNSVAQKWRDIAALYWLEFNLNKGLAVENELEQLVDSIKSDYQPRYFIDWKLAELNAFRDNHDKASELFQNSLTRADIPLDIAEIKTKLGLSLMMRAWRADRKEAGKLLSSAEENLEHAIRIAKEFQASKIQGEALLNIAGIQFVKDDKVSLLKYLEKSAEVNLRIKALGNAAKSLMHIGDLYKSLGNLRKAQASYLKALEIDQDNHNHAEVAVRNAKLSRLYLQLGDYNSALKYAINAKDLYQKAGQKQRYYYSKTRLAEVYLNLQKPDLARPLLSSALEFFSDSKWQVYSQQTKSLLSRLEYSSGNIPRALELSQGIINNKRHKYNLQIYLNHAQLQFLSQPQQAIEFLEKQISEGRFKNPAEKIEILATLMSFHHQRQNDEQAQLYAEQCFSLAEDIRTSFDTVRLGPLWSGKINSYYADRIEYLLNKNSPKHTAEAIFALERASAMAFRMRRQEVLHNKENTEALALLLELNSKFSNKIKDNIKHQLHEESRYQSIQRFYALNGIPPKLLTPVSLSFRQIQESLKDEQLSIRFFSSHKNIWRIELSNKSTKVTNLGPIESIEPAITAGLAELKSHQNANQHHISKLANTLYQGVTISDRQELLITANTLLQNIPHGALLYHSGAAKTLPNTVNVLSLSEYLSSRTGLQATSNALKLAVLADPYFGENSNTLRPALKSLKLRNWENNLSRLPYSAQEASNLSKYYREEDKLILLDTKANQKAFFSPEVTNANILHIASHGYFDKADPDLVGFAVAKQNENSDGFVSLAEISSYKFNNDLVVISACDTARGLDVPGEGALSLSRTFLAQGARAVISTLWPVSDAATAKFMKEFYYALHRKGFDYAKSLQYAQIQMQKHRRYRKPFYWAGFILTEASHSPAPLH